MTTRRVGRRPVRRATKKPMAWFNNGVDLGTLLGSTSITFPTLTLGFLPEGYSAGMTILRLIIRITFSPLVAAEIVNALTAFYVGRRGTAAVPPNLNADLLDYYHFAGLQSVQSPVGISATVLEADIRSARKIRGDRDLFWRVTNNEVTSMQVGMECRMLLTPS